MAHAVIQAIDISGAVAMSGVVAAYTHADLGLANLPPIMDMTPVVMTRSVLASGTVRYVGEPIVAIVAETREAAADPEDCYCFATQITGLGSSGLHLLDVGPDLSRPH
jgi:aerobic carbon-monoxide dehydrogenase large subunit